MLLLDASQVEAKPFPHVVKEGILPADLYAALKADFPGGAVFSGQAGAHGSAGSRTGSGQDVYRGDPAFEALTQTSPAWREFAGYINSDAFLTTFRSVFAAYEHKIGLGVDLVRSRIDPSYVEPRTQLSETATLGDKVSLAMTKLLGEGRKPKPVELFTRLDIHRSMGGYAKPAHCDRPNRLCSLIVYFTDADAAGLEGGDLLIFEHTEAKNIDRYERHPRRDVVTEVARLRPKDNLGVFFPCQNNSYHGVTQVTSSGVARDFLYINISGRKTSLWKLA
jgi:hypothetical protein